MAHRIQYILVCLTAGFLSILPVRLRWRIVSGAARLLCFFMSRRRIAEDNLRQAFSGSMSEKEIRRTAEEGFVSAALAVADLLTVSGISRNPADFFTIYGREIFENEQNKGKGVILVCAHLGSWELLAFLFKLTGRKVSVIVKDIRNPLINRKVNQARRLMGLNPISKNSSMRAVFRELRAGNTVAILIDQWSGPDGLWLDFFGRKTSTTPLPYRLAVRTGASLVPAFCIREGGGHYQIQVGEPVLLKDTDNEESVTLRLNRILEEKIRQYPGQWTWGHRRWKARPVPVPPSL